MYIIIIVCCYCLPVRENQVENEPVPAPVPPVREDGPQGDQPLEPVGERAETNNQGAESNDQGAESNNEPTNQVYTVYAYEYKQM